MSDPSPNPNKEAITVRDELQKEDDSSATKKEEKMEPKTSEDEPIAPMRAYFKLWSYASPLDNILRCLAALAAAGSGTAEPLMAIIFGNLVNLFNGTSPITPEEFRSQVNKNALYFVYLFIGKFAVSLYSAKVSLYVSNNYSACTPPRLCSASHPRE